MRFSMAWRALMRSFPAKRALLETYAFLSLLKLSFSTQYISYDTCASCIHDYYTEKNLRIYSNISYSIWGGSIPPVERPIYPLL